MKEGNSMVLRNRNASMEVMTPKRFPWLGLARAFASGGRSLCQQRRANQTITNISQRSKIYAYRAGDSQFFTTLIIHTDQALANAYAVTNRLSYFYFFRRMILEVQYTLVIKNRMKVEHDSTLTKCIQRITITFQIMWHISF
jgi:hypothetical protein